MKYTINFSKESSVKIKSIKDVGYRIDGYSGDEDLNADLYLDIEGDTLTERKKEIHDNDEIDLGSDKSDESLDEHLLSDTT